MNTRQVLERIDHWGERWPSEVIAMVERDMGLHPDRELLLDRARYWDAQKWGRPGFVNGACRRLADAIADVAYWQDIADVATSIRLGPDVPNPNFLLQASGFRLVSDR